MALKVNNITVVDNSQAANVTSLTVSGGSITAGGGTGTSGQVLQSTGSGVHWATLAASSPNLDSHLSFFVNYCAIAHTGYSNIGIGSNALKCNCASPGWMAGSYNIGLGSSALQYKDRKSTRLNSSH